MIKSHLKRIVFGATLGLVGGVVYWKTTPAVYQGDAQVFINTTSGKVSDDLSQLLQMGLAQSAASEAAILKSPGTFRQAVFNVADRLGDRSLAQLEAMDELYLMYDIEMMRDSRVMTVKVRAYSPKVATEIANEIVTVYNDKRRSTSSSSYTNAQYTVQEQLGQTKNTLDRIERNIKAFQERNGVVDMDETVKNISRYQAILTQQMSDAKGQETILNATIAATSAAIAQLPRTEDVSLSQIQNPELTSLEMKIAGYMQQRTEMLRLYNPTSSRVKDLDDLIARTQKRQLELQKNLWKQTTKQSRLNPIRSGFEQQLASEKISLVSLKAKMRSVEKGLAGMQAAAAALPAKQREYTALTRDKQVYQDRYTSLRTKLTDLQLQSTANFLPAVNLYPATVQDKPVAPLPNKILPLGFLVGGIVGLLYGFARESLRSTARTSDEVSALFELPVVATVPTLSELVIRRRLLGLPSRTHTPQESFRFMASATALAQGGPRRVVFTSSGGNVGCSSAAGEYAVAAARMGLRTILIDADVTFGTLTKVFKMTDKPGLRDLLGRKLLATEEAPLVYETEHPNLHVLPIGGDKEVEVSDTPTALLQGLLDSLQEQAELIVIDCPPVDVMADTSRFVPLATEVCLVVSAKKTSVQAVSLAKVLLERCNARAVSVVLTGTAPKSEAFTPNNRYLAARR